MELRVLSWNVQHGRASPPAGHGLFGAFAAALGGWSWDVALLQEVPPWWPAPLAERLGAEGRLVLTSRNFGLALRRAVAVRRPDLLKSNGGGGNAILVRGAVIREHRVRRLRRLPERRWVHAVRLASGVWVANLHVGNGDRAAERDSARAGETVLRWAAGAPTVLGGDFNLHAVPLPGFTWAGGHGVDQVFVAGLEALQGGGAVLDRGRLSDHAPVLVRVGIQLSERRLVQAQRSCETTETETPIGGDSKPRPRPPAAMSSRPVRWLIPRPRVLDESG